MVSLKDKGNKAEDYVLVNGGERFKVTRIEDHDGGDSLPFLVHFERDGCHDQWYMERNGTYDKWHLETVSVRGTDNLRIFDFGDVKANPHDIQIHYEDYGDQVKLVDVINMMSVVDMVDRFGLTWFDEHYRFSSPKADFVSMTMYVYEGEEDYCRAKKNLFEIGETYNKADFMRCMKLVQEAAKNLSRLRKEFGVSKKKTITI